MSGVMNTYIASPSEKVLRPLTLDALLRERAIQSPATIAYTFLGSEGEEQASLTYKELDRQARVIAAYLQLLNVSGKRVLLLYPPGLDYITAFFGCLYAGAVAVPAYPPRPKQSMNRLQSIVADARPSIALTVATILAKADAMFEQSPEFKELRLLATDRIGDDLSGLWCESAGTGGDALAFLQYTSGSTSKPRGVMVSHGNLLHNQRLIQESFRQTEQSVVVGWLPLYHDMGLIGNVLQPLFVGARCVLMSPLTFLQTPFRWLEAISRYRATTTGGPNFAYDLCVRKINDGQRALLDLSSWTVAFNGAEPVRAQTLKSFASAFESCGFRREAFHPCYGLAESTLLVSTGQVRGESIGRSFDAELLRENRVAEVSDGDDGAATLVGCGMSLEGRVSIVDPATLKVCEEGTVGEVWVGGESVARGYWMRAEATEQTFASYTAGNAEGPFLRTGDLGFIHRDELFITGRLKDLIIIRGLNHYPQDIELTAETSTAGLKLGCGAAFCVEAEGEERLVVVQEADPRRLKDAAAALNDIRQAVALQHEVQPYAVLLLRAGSIPKTSSGKIQRHECRARFEAGKLDVVAEWRETETSESSWTTEVPRSVNEIEEWLVAQLASKIGARSADIEVGQTMVSYGLDSLAAVELVHAVETTLGVTMPAMTFLTDFSIARLAAELALQAGGDGSTAAVPAESEPVMGHPLSYGQQTIWFLHRLDPQSPAYNVSVPLRVSGRLDARALRHAFLALVQRHASLRTTFGEIEGEPVQRIHQQLEPLFEEHDATAWDDDAVKTYLIEESRRPFDLEQGPLLRIHLLRRAEERHVMLLVLHHIAVDFWSLAILTQELGEFYSSQKSGAAPDLAPLSPRYADYVHWQREMFASPRSEGLRAYWEQQLSGDTPALDLPGDNPRPAEQSFRGESEVVMIDEELTRGLRELSRSRGATLYMTLLAAFQVLLYRYTGQRDFFIGSPTAGRSRAEWARLVGYFVNPVVLRARLPEGQTFLDHLEEQRLTVLAALEHQDYPFALLVEALGLGRDLSRPQMLQVMFSMQRAHLFGQDGLAMLALPGDTGTSVPMADLQLEAQALPEQIAQFDLTLVMAPVGNGLAASLQYNADVFRRERITRMLHHYLTLLAEVVADPNTRISSLNILSKAERERQLVEWNRTWTDYPNGVCVPRLFEEQAKKNPGALAVVCGPERLTYEDLNRRANRLARRLRTLGVRPEVAVAICVERSVEMVIAQLAVLKAGGYYVSLDPSYPSERLAYMLEDSRAPVLLTRKHRAALPICEAQLVEIDDPAAVFAESDEDFECDVSPDNLAYMIYTSGSTGLPKGVGVRHGGLVNLITWHQQAYGVTSGERATQLTSPAFDASVWELWPYLTAGASVHFPDDSIRASAPELWKWIVSEDITICFLPTPLAEAVLDAGVSADEQLSLRVLLTGGDKLQRVPAGPLPFTLVNHYGPTENTVVATRARVTPGADSKAAPPIGSPIANTQAYILDRDLQSVPVGVAGELYLGGDGLARGYHARPELTAECFVPNPFSDEPGARLYRTGDLVRYLTDGRLEFVGRLDHQVKVSGFRIELGEVEAKLREHSSIREAVVVAHGGDESRKRLVAYVVAAGEGSAVSGELRDYLKEKLPEYMIPSQFIMLAELPLTPNGKVDRAVLPEPAEVVPGRNEGFALSPVEEVLAGIWRLTLKVADVGPHDNFFELGGHSLLATQVISRVRECFRVELPLRSLFETPTVAGLAAQVEIIMRSGQESSTPPPLVSVLRDRALPLSSAQQRLWFLDRLDPNKSLYNIPAAVLMQGPLCIASLRRSLNEIVRRHETLRTTFAVDDGQPVQLIAPALELELPLIDLEGDRAWERLAADEAQAPFDLTAGPLVRTKLIRLGDEKHILLLTLHHIVSDGWSMGVLIREMKALYEAYVEGRESPLPELTIQYADFAQWQKQLVEGDLLRGELDYWRARLTPAPPVLELLADRPRHSVQTYNGSAETLTLPMDMKDSLKALSLGEGVTLFMTLLAAFNVLLQRYTGQTDIALGTPIAGRNNVETEGLIGFFANTLVLRTDLSSDPTFRELLKRVRETALGAYLHQNVPFERLVEQLQPARDLSHTPLFQVMMALQNAHTEALELTGLSLTLLDVPTTSAKFDLLMFCEEREEGLKFTLEYNTDLFERATVCRLLQHWQNLLAGVLAAPDTRLSSLRLMGPDEQRQVLQTWNDTARDYAGPQLIHELFERQAEKTPDAVALRMDQKSVTYRELNERANRLAHHLIALGVGPEVLVGVLRERSVEMVVALLGVLKAGGAYVPLDPQYPAPRMSFIVEDTHAPILLTSEALRGRLPQHSAHVVLVDDEEIEQFSTANPCMNVLPEDLAYVIYTSGSTGVPKGVAITHASASTFLNWSLETFTREQLRGVLAATSICFDLSVFELFAPLACGGTVILAENALQLPVLASATEVTLVNTVPSAIAELARQRAIPAGVNTVNLAGEALQQNLVDEIFASAASVEQVWNLYGPSEDTTYSTGISMRREGPAVSIGRPIARRQAYILDAHMQPVVVGVAGELYLSGAGLARCYLNRPAQTAERFLPHPFSAEPGARLYRTGDLARFLPDGRIEFLGRLDNQVKIRGFRIELGEIESALTAHAGVEKAVVVAREEGGGKSLVAYVVACGADSLGVEELRSYLRERLPVYMMPSAFVLLDDLPLTANGKVNRRALPVPDADRRDVAGVYIAPRNATEEALVAIWGKVLTRGRIGINDNFFDLGGHSLLATQAMAKLTQHFGIELPLRAIFESPTVRELAAAVEAARNSAGTPAQAATIQPFPREAFRARALSGRNFEMPEILKKTDR